MHSKTAKSVPGRHLFTTHDHPVHLSYGLGLTREVKSAESSDEPTSLPAASQALNFKSMEMSTSSAPTITRWKRMPEARAARSLY